jgi:hypothetical protein
MPLIVDDRDRSLPKPQGRSCMGCGKAIASASSHLRSYWNPNCGAGDHPCCYRCSLEPKCPGCPRWTQ